jgi:hypothetical protein
VGAYDRVDGVFHFAVDPNSKANRAIVDLSLAKRNRQGLVEFSSDFVLLVPAARSRGNRRLIVDVVNRGRPRVVPTLNLAEPTPAGSAEIPEGDGFLFARGYAIVSIGWQWDVLRGDGLLGLEAPEALRLGGAEPDGRARVENRPDRPQRTRLLADRVHRPNPTAHRDDPTAELYVRQWEDGPATLIPRERWRFAKEAGRDVVPSDEHVYMESGFQPGDIYHLVYTPAAAPVVGAGLLAVRDVAAFLRHPSESNPAVDGFDWVYGYGVSQTGRLLRHFAYLGLNVDEGGRKVYDGLLPHVAGGRMGEFNHRFAQPSAQSMPGFGHRPPFSDNDALDLFSGESDGLLHRLRELNAVPKIVYTNTSAEYWRGDGSLVHIDARGERDLEPAAESRIYHFAGTQHIDSRGLPPPGSDAADGTWGRHPPNVVDYRPLLRAAFLHLDRWASEGVEPPPSKHPRLDDGSAVSRQAALDALPAIPQMAKPDPEQLWRLREMDLGSAAGRGVGRYPVQEARDYPSFVAALDSDGNEVAGIRLPDISVPLGTYTGWNPRHPETSSSRQIIPMQGSTHAFAPTRSARLEDGDSRPAIEERYPDRRAYVEQARVDAKALASARYLLDDDIDVVVSALESRYDELMAAAGRSLD